MRVYDMDIHIRLKPSDYKLIKERMAEAGVQNMSAYMRKMAIDGYVVNLDLSDVKEVVRLLRYSSNNLNQYAKKANENGSVYARDIEDLKVRYDKLWDAMNEILTRLSMIM